MKILFLARYLNSSGVTKHMVTLGEGFIEQGHEVAILSGGVVEGCEKGVATLMDDVNIKVIENGFPVKRTNPLLESFNYFFTVPSTLYKIKSFNPDVIHIHWPITTYIAKLYQKVFNVPIVQTFHLSGIKKSVLHLKADAAIAISSDLQKEISDKFDYSGNEIYKVYNGISRKEFFIKKEEKRTIREKNNIAQEEIIISFIGEISKRKGLDILIKALSEVKKNYRFKMKIVGQGDKAWLENLLVEFDLKNEVEILPFQQPYEIYAISDLMVLPSRNEGFPLVVVEAMLMGVPVVRSICGGAKDQINHEIDGLLFKSEDVDELAECLKILIKDAELREEFGNRAKIKAEELFTSDKMVRETLRVYEMLLN